MRKITTRLTIRLIIGIGATLPFVFAPALASAQAPGALTQLTGSSSCIEVATDSPECPTDPAEGLNGAQDVVVTPLPGNNVYAIGSEYDDGSDEDAIVEFTRNPDGSLTYIGCIADKSANDGNTCDTATATGLVDPQAIAISADGQNVYVAAEDSNGNGDVAEFTRDANGTLTQISGSDCIQEGTEEESGCDVQDARGLEFPIALAVSPDGDNVYVGDESGDAITTLTRDAADGSLSEPGGADDCIEDPVEQDGGDCDSTAAGLSEVTGVAVSPDGDDVYTTGAPNSDENGSIAEFSRGEDGALSSIGCLGTPEDADDESCGGGTATGVIGITGLVISPDGNNVYTASESIESPIAEFSRDPESGALSQLTGANNCIQEQDEEFPFTCGTTTGIGIASGYRLVVSPDGADVYAAAPEDTCSNDDGCADVAEFARSSVDGSLTELPSPDTCIQDSSVEGDECPANENGTGLGGPGLAISPDGNNLYVTGTDDVAEFARGTHTLTVSPAGSGTGAVADDTGAISCPSACSNAYTTDTTVTLTASPASGSTFSGWSGGGCSGIGTCQVVMNADTNVTATFTSTAAPSPGSPTPVLTGAPTTVTDGGAGFSGSVNPDGLPTTAYFQYGLDKKYSQVGASGANYTAQTQPQTVGSDFTTHGVGPVTVAGLVPNALYHVRLVATNSAGTTFGQDVTFTTAAAPAPGSPTLGQTFNIKPVSGLVLIDINGHLVPLTELTQIPPGVAIDTLHGTLELVTATGGGGGGAHDAAAKTQHGEFSGAVFRLSQQTRGAGKGLVTIMMALSAFKGAPSQAICRNNGAASDAHAASSSKAIQLLHASAHGKFRTSGRYSAATVLGTIWTVTARCDGTLTHAIKDEVEVTDFVRHKTIILHAGQSYLAPGPFKRP